MRTEGEVRRKSMGASDRLYMHTVPSQYETSQLVPQKGGVQQLAWGYPPSTTEAELPNLN